ncbi:MAG TPA: type VI secretion system-associated FHA domain protein TagH, partial [Gammaproteobacteria bacterium]|nr:type VI secretion system-associated FHA domain protein TagH [Gammaproteobacteria bacterium]
RPQPGTHTGPIRPQPGTHTGPIRPQPQARTETGPIHPQPPHLERPAARPLAPAAAPGVEDSGIEKPLSAFFRGAGLKDRNMNEQELNAMLFLLGQLVRELMHGVTSSLHMRAQQKNELKLASTTIQKRDNNPLKFSAGTTEALTNLLFRTSREYLGPVEAVRGAFADINAHQQSLLNALNAAVPEYVSRLDPVVLEDKFSRATGSSLIGATSKLKHWELYKDLFQVVAHRNPGQLPSQFLEQLAQAYEAECEREAVTRGRTDSDSTQS